MRLSSEFHKTLESQAYLCYFNVLYIRLILLSVLISSPFIKVLMRAPGCFARFNTNLGKYWIRERKESSKSSKRFYALNINRTKEMIDSPDFKGPLEEALNPNSSSYL